jgi:hypothetical protein
MRGSIFALFSFQMTVAYECLISEGWLPSKPLSKHPDYIGSSSLPVVVSTNNFSPMLTGYLYRVIGAAIVGNNDLVNACQ